MFNRTISRPGKKSSAALLASLTLLMTGCSDSDDPLVLEEKTYVRAVHAVPDAPPVNILFNGNARISMLDYANSSGFKGIDDGTYDIAVSAIVPGDDPSVIEVNGTALAEDAMTTIFAVGTVDTSDDADPSKQLDALIVSDPVNEPEADEITIKVVHAAPAAADVDIYITAFGGALGTPIDADYLDSAELPAPVDASASYQVRITEDGNSANVLYDSGELDLSAYAGEKLLVAAMNTTNQLELDSSPVKLVVITEASARAVANNNSLDTTLLDTDTETGAKVVHLSPDAADAAGGAVEVYANGTVQLIDEFSYGDIVVDTDEYAPVAAGDYIFSVSPDTDTNADAVYTSGELALLAGAENTVIAVGYVVPTDDQPAFELIASADENRAYATHARVKVIHAAAAVEDVDVYVTAAGNFNSTNVVAGATALLTDFAFKGDSGYVDVAADALGTDYDIFVMAAGTSTLVTEALSVTITAGDVLSVVARGPDESAGAVITTAGLVVLTN